MRLQSLDSHIAKLVINHIEQNGPSTPEEIGDELDEPLLCILGVINILVDEEHVEHQGEHVRLKD